MSSFPSAARKVRDDSLAPKVRSWALRECVLRFAPYGFLATWHHLVVNAAVPARPEDDPAALVRALDELEEAREVWQRVTRAYRTRRRAEKSVGRRTPLPVDRWRNSTLLAFCPDFTTHPTERLVVVVVRVLAGHESRPVHSDSCRACGAPTFDLVCPACGVADTDPSTRRPREPAHVARRWREVWTG
ncbi:hypothetical protein [Saccharothrix violaceirubra]|uniref:Uncharacterized protein n=1 Tax=Saccharothrix violaceirubra TaxID=413306 RepID=A0A7W7T433_9PSEU|nr:hypothetical protein [Saccharothrix violaceirubra]MBB4966190.1 hypothetical protein [Saccharothrix violaceirubra]